ncbi:4-hydroxythreonine-4-phosphate dehydrogenase [Campylobacter troglodytis]|uniref:4-hydroxythreonine-4-phosphate dehydrogenase n=1 Tax=Campylobacter troglodytis TaxID=654363 RepID=UPI001157BADE|nr:4-hydroxythreonine-4-phosphate dehydrogenase [Campylobacter troglodytis]TQR60577.1 4-hydroxythreonine-4-phosphate dehydrogenase [Campylobacter troglodytis]
MLAKPKIAISIGDINGIGLEIALKSHNFISKYCTPYYFIHESLLNQALKRLNSKKPKHFTCVEFSNASKMSLIKGQHKDSLCFEANLACQTNEKFKIKAGKIDSNSGSYSFASFKFACEFVKMGFARALITLPIHKKAWSEAGLTYKGHTQALGEFFGRQAIMMLGCKELFIGLFTEHIPLSEVSFKIKAPKLCEFLITFYKETRFKKIGVLSFNPHASDFGTIGGKEELEISRALKITNVFLNVKTLSNTRQKRFLNHHKIEFENLLKSLLDDEILLSNLSQSLEKEAKFKHFYLPNPLVADTAFTKNSLKQCNRLISMSHDLALAPLKALFFEKSVNVSLNLPIIRTSVDHGTAFDKAYKNAKISTKSYKEAIAVALKLIIKKKNKA